METQLKMIQGLRILFFSTEMDEKTWLECRTRWFRLSGQQKIIVKKAKLQRRQRTNCLKRLTMKIRIRLLRWLSLLQFPALPGDQSGRLTHPALF